MKIKSILQSLFMMTTLCLISCSETGNIEMIEVSDTEIIGELLADLYIDINEDGVDDLYLWSFGGNNAYYCVSLKYFEALHDGAFLYTGIDSALYYFAIDTVVTLDTVMPFVLNTFHHQSSCAPISSPNLITLKTSPKLYYSLNPEEVSDENNRWQSKRFGYPIKNEQAPEPLGDFAFMHEEFDQIRYENTVDCDGPDIGASVYYYTKVCNSEGCTIGRISITRESEFDFLVNDIFRYRDE